MGTRRGPGGRSSHVPKLHGQSQRKKDCERQTERHHCLCETTDRAFHFARSVGLPGASHIRVAPELHQGLALFPNRGRGGKIAAMKRWLTIALGLVLATGLASCGGSSSTATCGVSRSLPHPEIGGEVLYYCTDWPHVNGGIYLLDVAIGRVRALTSDLAWNLDGAWSTDGSRIAFQSTRDGHDDIFVMDSGGGGVHRLTDGRGFNEYPSWSPDGRWIIFNSTRDGVARSTGTGYYRDLYLVHPDGTDIHRLTSHVGTFNFAAWNPNGRTLAFQSDNAGTWNIYTMGIDGSGLEQLTHYEKSGGSAGFPRWSPDGSRLVFGASVSGEPASIYWLEVGQGQLHRVTSGAPQLQWDGYPDWSPDGSWIAFERNGNDAQLFAVRPDGSNLTKLTEGPGFKALPRWRPQ